MSRFSRVLLIAISIACISGAFVSVRAALRNTALVLTVDSSDKYLGTLNQEEKKDATFVLTNRTGREIEIVQVTPSCTCTLTALPQTLLEDGASANLVATLTSGHNRGMQTSAIDVVYEFKDTSERLRLPLLLRAIVTPDFQVEPSELRFGSAAAESQVIVIKNRNADVKVEDVYSTHSAFAVKAVSPPDAEYRQEITVELKTDHLDGHPINADLVLKPLNAKETEFHMKLRFVPDTES